MEINGIKILTQLTGALVEDQGAARTALFLIQLTGQVSSISISEKVKG